MGFLTFEHNITLLNYIGGISDLLFISDLIINCFTAYYNSKEELVTDRKVRIFVKMLITKLENI